MRKQSLVAIVAAFIPLTAAAVPVTYDFAGVLNQGSWQTDDPIDFGALGFGVSFLGSVTVETETPLFFQGADFAIFRNAVTDVNVQFGAGGLVGSFALGGVLPPASYQSQITIVSDSPFGAPALYDQVILGAALANAAGDPGNLQRSFGLSGSTTTNDLFPVYPTLDNLFSDLAAYTSFPLTMSMGLTLRDPEGNWLNDGSIGGTVTSLTVRAPASVPQPGTLALFGAALVGVWLARRQPARAPG